jgi:hypothetical protein
MKVYLYAWENDSKVSLSSDTDDPGFGALIAQVLDQQGPFGDVTIFEGEL